MRRAATVAFVLLVVVVVAAELLAPRFVASRAEAAITEATGGRIETDVEVSGPPLLVPLAVTSRVESWHVRLARVAGRDLPVDVLVDLDELTLDRGRLARGDVVVTDVARARVRVRADLSGSVPPALRGLADAVADAGVEQLLALLGDELGVSTAGGALRVGDLSLPLVEGSCRFLNDQLVVTARCDLTEVPDFLLGALGGA